MRLEESLLNPLHTLWNLIPEEGIYLSRENLTNLGNIFKTGGVIAEDYHEVIKIIQLIEEWYGIWSIKLVDTKYYLIRKTNGENS